MLRKRAALLFVALFFLPVLLFSIWYGRQVRQQNLDHSLIEAIKKEDTPTAISLLDQGADANATDKPYTPVTFKSILAGFWNRLKGNKLSKEAHVYTSALLLPYRQKHFEEEAVDNHKLVAALLEHGANCYATDVTGETILHFACMFNHPRTVEVLLEHHVNPNVKRMFGDTPLMDSHDFRTSQILLNHEANINMQDLYGKTALIYAIESYDDNARLRLLLQYGAEVTLKDKTGKTALNYAKETQAKDMIPLLEASLKKDQVESQSTETGIK